MRCLIVVISCLIILKCRMKDDEIGGTCNMHGVHKKLSFILQQPQVTTKDTSAYLREYC